MKKLAAVLFLAIFMLPVLPHTAAADPHHDHDGDHRHGHGHNRHFEWHDYDSWRGGRWYHGKHDGRRGWWWTVGTSYYYYDAPVYPYPSAYVPPVVVPVSTRPAGSFWYYCSRPRGYYPYVSVCGRPWRAVAAY